MVLVVWVSLALMPISLAVFAIAAPSSWMSTAWEDEDALTSFTNTCFFCVSRVTEQKSLGPAPSNYASSTTTPT